MIRGPLMKIIRKIKKKPQHKKKDPKIKPSKNAKLNLFIEGTDPTLKSMLGSYTVVLGIRGSGKSNSAAVIAEEYLKKNIPITLVDIDGEHTKLKKKFPMIKIMNYKNKIPLDDIDKFVKKILDKNVPVILDLHAFPTLERDQFLQKYFEALWDYQLKKKVPHVLIVEESHEFLPQSKSNDTKEILNRIALRGRKRGLSAVLISQRSAKIDKDSITQADHQYLMKVTHPADMKVYKEIIPLKSNNIKSEIKNLKTGEALYVKGAVRKVKFRERETPHGGHTPGINKIRKLGRIGIV